MAADYSVAQEHFVPRPFMFNSNDPKAVVIHKTGGDATPADVLRTFLNSGNPGKSSHYIIGTDGAIWQCVPEHLGAGANGVPGPNIEAFWQPYLAKYGNLNMCTISIEHCDGSPRNDTPLTPAQKQASFALVAHLCQKYNIPPDHIKPHRSIASTDCPGTYPMAELISFVQQGGTMPVPPNWHDSNNTLTAPNGIAVVKGFRDHILNAASWDGGNQPQEAEYHADQVLLHNTSVGAGQRQCFRDSLLWYTTSKGVVEEPYLGLELDAAYKLIAQQQAQIAALKAQQPAPASVDTTQAVADVQAIADDVAAAVAAGVAKAVLTIKKL